MTDLDFFIVDVFARSRYAGNQLAVVKDDSGLSPSQMQKIAREFNFSETTFIKSREKNSFKVRIFTPKGELPFAGHPSLGTAWVIQQHIIRSPIPTVTLRLGVGEIQVTFHYIKNKPGMLWMKQKEPKFGETFSSGVFSKILGLEESEIDESVPIQVVSTGVPFFIVPVKTLRSLKACRIARDQYFRLVDGKEAKAILVFSPEAYGRSSDLAVRVFADFHGIAEDPATGSGNGCLAAYLSKHNCFGKSEIRVVVDQGYEIGRPSKIFLRVERVDGVGVMVGGGVFPVARGKITI